eukprot:381619-Rhodomonas_salina.1
METWYNLKRGPQDPFKFPWLHCPLPPPFDKVTALPGKKPTQRQQKRGSVSVGTAYSPCFSPNNEKS